MGEDLVAGAAGARAPASVCLPPLASDERGGEGGGHCVDLGYPYKPSFGNGLFWIGVRGLWSGMTGVLYSIHTAFYFSYCLSLPGGGLGKEEYKWGL